MSRHETLLAERDGPVATLTMNRPAQLNALYRQSYASRRRRFCGYASSTSAKELIFTGDRIDATEAERIGMINRVVEVDELDEAVYGLAQRICERSPLALGISKKLIDVHAEGSLASYFEASSWADAMLVQADEHAAEVQEMKKRAGG